MKAAKESCKHRLWLLASHSPPSTPSWLEGQDYLLILNELSSIRLHSIFLARFCNSWGTASVSPWVDAAFFIFMGWFFGVLRWEEKVPARSQHAELTSSRRRNRSSLRGYIKKINKNTHCDFYIFCPCCPAPSKAQLWASLRSGKALLSGHLWGSSPTQDLLRLELELVFCTRTGDSTSHRFSQNL